MQKQNGTAADLRERSGDMQEENSQKRRARVVNCPGTIVRNPSRTTANTQYGRKKIKARERGTVAQLNKTAPVPVYRPSADSTENVRLVGFANGDMIMLGFFDILCWSVTYALVQFARTTPHTTDRPVGSESRATATCSRVPRRRTSATTCQAASQ